MRVSIKDNIYSMEIIDTIKLFYFNENIELLSEEDTEELIIKVEMVDGYATSKIIDSKKTILESREHILDLKIEEKDNTKKEKITIKKSIYKLLSQYRQMTPPWGILTGVRPTKIIHTLEEKGLSRTKVKEILKYDYKLREDKMALIDEIADRQKKYIYPLDSRRFSIYINIPFCPTKCIYCSFASKELGLKKTDQLENYTEKLIEEISIVLPKLKNNKINTLYFGGGTPTTLSSSQLERIINTIYSFVKKEDIKEITVEAGRPDTITEENLQILYGLGVNRISINPQTMNDEILKKIRRNHTSEDVIESYKIAKKIGFDFINMDVIAGLPEETVESFKNTMEKIYELSPDNLTVHTLSIKRSSEVNNLKENIYFTEEKKLVEMLDISKYYAEKMDMVPYYMYRQKQILGNFENTGYTKEAKECIYNVMIMEEKETILAFGAGGVSKIYYPLEDRFERESNVKSIEEYINRNIEMAKRKEKYFMEV